MPSRTQIHVALVEDDASMQQAMRRLLRAHDMRITVFSSAEDFLAAAQDDPPDCLLLDIQLEGMSGLELQALLVMERPGLPIIFLTSHREESYRLTATSIGCAAYFNKTTPADVVVTAIRDAATHPASA